MNGATQTARSTAAPKTTGRKVVSVFMIIFGIFMTIIAIAGIFSGPDEESGYDDAAASRDRAIGIPILLLLGVTPLAIGIALFRGAGKVDREHVVRSREQAVIDAAARNGGVVTVAMIMRDTRLSSAEASAVLNELCRQGIAEPDLLAEGGVEYRFTGLIGPG